MRAIGRLGVSVLALLALAGGWSLAVRAAAVEIRPGVVVVSDDPAQQELARWAVARFERAGLDAPTVQIRFHADRAGCGGHLGYARDGRVDVCTVLVNEMARRNLLHEMGHIWIDQHVSRSVRDRFLELRGLQSWNASTDPWEARGYEQGAEIIAWALGNRILSAQIPDHRPVQLSAGFELLVGIEPSVGETGSPPDAVRSASLGEPVLCFVGPGGLEIGEDRVEAVGARLHVANHRVPERVSSDLGWHQIASIQPKRVRSQGVT